MYSTTKDEAVQSLKNTAQNVREDVRSATNEAKGELLQIVSRTGRSVKGFINTAGDEFSHAADSVKTQIRTKPVQSSVIALGIGVVLGLLLRR